MKQTKTNIFFKILIIIFSLFLISAIFFFFINSAPQNSNFGEFTVKDGASARLVANDLKEQNFIKSAIFFYVISRFSKDTIKAGTYFIKEKSSTLNIFEQLKEGKQEIISVTIPEGLTLSKTAELFEEKGIVSSADFIREATNPSFLVFLGIKGKSAEGFLFPETYGFYKNTPAKDVVLAMVTQFWDVYKSIDVSLTDKPTDKKLSEIYQTIILASIVEREYQIPEEAPIIAGVFKNRLKIKMGLQSCATVEYIITEIQHKPHPGFITPNETSINNPYNTYLWAGLPPGPIANPGKVALEATLNPAIHNFLFFRLVDANRGFHHFSETYEEHSQSGAQFYRTLKKGNK